MAAISLWMLALALMGVAGVLTDHYPGHSFWPYAQCLRRRRPGNDPPATLGMGAYAGRGLLLHVFWLLQRFSAFTRPTGGFMAVINLVFFLYLVRSEVIGRLR